MTKYNMNDEVLVRRGDLLAVCTAANASTLIERMRARYESENERRLSAALEGPAYLASKGAEKQNTEEEN